MATFLLTWNPRRWPWDELEDDLRDFRRDSYLDGHWSCGVTKHIAEGDRFFLIRLGEEPRGIVASGTVQRHNLFEDEFPVQNMSDVYEGPHWEDSGRTALYVNVRFDKMLDPEVNVFPLDRLDELNEELPPDSTKQVWTSQSSGIRIRDDIAAKLEAEWRRYSPAIEPVPGPNKDLDEEGRDHARALQRSGGGEGTPHLQLKRYVAHNPQAIGLRAAMVGMQEYVFPSGDECDVVFHFPEEGSAVVEVKNGESRGELVKGIYQAVKYRALMAAEKGRGDEYPVKAYLVAFDIPTDIAQYAADLEIECKTIDHVSVSNRF